MLLGYCCSMLSTILFGIVTPDCGRIRAQQYYSVLLTTMNNVAPTTLLLPVFNNLLRELNTVYMILSGKHQAQLTENSVTANSHLPLTME